MTTYQFPHIQHIDEVLEAIAGREEFVVKHDEAAGFKVVNYLVNFEDTFPPVTDRRTALIRECRGITFDAVTGSVIARKFHKFFNLNERPETQQHTIDFTKSHTLLEKLDGSMITFFKTAAGDFRGCTKMGLTEIASQVDGFTAKNPNYLDFMNVWYGTHTPIFEWCSRQQRIVIDYPVDRLVLTAIRENITGAYLTYEQLVKAAADHNIDVIKPHSGEISDGEEGYIIRFDDGHMLKVKGEWYVQLHKTLDHLRHEKDVIRLIVDEKIDDAKAFLPEDLVVAVDDFAKQIFTNVNALSDELFWETQACYDNFNGSKKKFAEHVMSNPRFARFSKLMFQTWDHLEDGEPWLRKAILEVVLANTSTQTKVNSMRDIIGQKTWRDFDQNRSEE